MDIPLATGFGSYVDNVGEVKDILGFETSLSGYVISGHRAETDLAGIGEAGL